MPKDVAAKYGKEKAKDLSSYIGKLYQLPTINQSHGGIEGNNLIFKVKGIYYPIMVTEPIKFISTGVTKIVSEVQNEE